MKRLLLGSILLASANCFADQVTEQDCYQINPLKKKYSLMMLHNELTNNTRFVLLKNKSQPLFQFDSKSTSNENGSAYEITDKDGDTLSVRFNGKLAAVKLTREGKKTIKSVMMCEKL